jgi:hypothetical protein
MIALEANMYDKAWVPRHVHLLAPYGSFISSTSSSPSLLSRGLFIASADKRIP